MKIHTIHNKQPKWPGMVGLGVGIVLLSGLPGSASANSNQAERPLPVMAAYTGEEVDTGYESFLNHIDGTMTKAFQDSLTGKNLVLAIFLSDFSSGNLQVVDDRWFIDDVEAEAMYLARKALYKAMIDSVNDVRVLRTAKEYGRNMTTAELAIKNGELDFYGPSLGLNNGVRHSGEEWQANPTFRSYLKLDARYDLAMSWRTTYGPLEYRLTYFLDSQDVIGMSIRNQITDRSSLRLFYRASQDTQRAMATFSFALP